MAIDKSQRILMLDTETTNTLDDPLCYDVGYEVFDLAGNLYDRNSFVNADIFLASDLMASAYFLDKLGQYREELDDGKRQLASWYHITKELYRTIKENDVKIVCAHNARFDYIALHTTQRYRTSSKWRWVLPWGVEWYDTLKMCRKVLGTDTFYKEWCMAHGFMTQNNQPKLTAEIIYKYISNNLEFTESHTGLEDVQIEKQILFYCLQRIDLEVGKLWTKPNNTL